MTHTLVDPEVTRRKFRRELAQWKEHGRPAERGWLLLREDEEETVVELAFLGRLALSTGSGPLAVVACAVRVSYENYDLWPPSVTFIDAFTRQPVRPHLNAFKGSRDGLRNVLINAHPETKQPFLCFAGIREYHSHPQHSGDDWLLHRQAGEGRLIVISERIWQYMVLSIVGLNVGIQVLPGLPMRGQLTVQIAQGEVNVAGAEKSGAAARDREEPRQQ